jgi:hypothetical protein
VLTLLGFSFGLAACGDDSVSHAGPSDMQNGVRLEITAANGTAFPKSGEYHYEVRLRLENGDTTSVQYTMSPTFYDSAGKPLEEIALPGFSSSFANQLTIRNETLHLYDRTLTNPWAERVAVRVTYQLANGGRENTLVASYPVTHGPVVARLHEFSVTPSDPGPGQPITIKWNVSGATRVQLTTWVFDPVRSSVVPLTDVEPVGRLTVVPLPHFSVGLVIDDWLPQYRPINIRP